MERLIYILIPIFPVFFLTHVIMSNGTTDQKNSKVYYIIVRHNALKPTNHTPTQSHDPVACVIDFMCQTPPSACQPFCLQESYMQHLQRIGIPYKCIPSAPQKIKYPMILTPTMAASIDQCKCGL